MGADVCGRIAVKLKCAWSISTVKSTEVTREKDSQTGHVRKRNDRSCCCTMEELSKHLLLFNIRPAT